MKYVLSGICFLLLPLVSAVGCAATPAAPATGTSSPAWVAALIKQLDAQPVANPPAFVARYDYKGQDVYFVPQRCCDVMSTVYRGDSSVLCHPDGGITGRGDGRCSDFLAERRNERIVWRDSRK